MRGAYRIPRGDWASRDSLAEITSIYVRPEDQADSASDEASPAAYPSGSSPNVRWSEPLERPHRSTHRVMRKPSKFPTAVVGVLSAIAIGVLAGVAVAFSGGGGAIAKLPASAAPVVHGPVVTPIAIPPDAGRSPAVLPSQDVDVPATAAAPTTVVEVHIDSTPSGGVATLIDGGAATQLGVTPLVVPLDPTRTYDIMVSLAGHTPRVAHVVPSAGASIVLALDDTARVPARDDVATPAVVSHNAAARHVAAVAKPGLPAVTATGMLRISSKPPCAIAIDGHPRGQTPQAAISLSIGTHEVTLTNEEQGINLTTAVEIRADRPTAVVQDFTE